MKIIFFLLLFSLFFNSIYVSVQCIIYITVKKSCKYGTSCEINSVLGTVVIPLPGLADWPGTFQVSQKCCYACGWKKCHNSIENQYFEQFWTPKLPNGKCDYLLSYQCFSATSVRYFSDTWYMSLSWWEHYQNVDSFSNCQWLCTTL